MIITNLVASVLLTMGVATSATPFNLETKPNEIHMDSSNENVTSFTYQPPLTNSSYAAITYTYPLGSSNVYKQNSRKHTFNGYNEAVAVYGTMITESTVNNSDEVTLELAEEGVTNYTNKIVYNDDKASKTNNLFALQITPYRYFSDAQATLSLFLTTKLDIQISTQDPQYEWIYYSGPFYIQYDIFTSVDNNWRQYIDTATWNTGCYNNNVIANLTSSENGYTYNKETIIKTINIQANGNTSWNIFNQNINLDIVGDKDNYVYIMMTPYFKINTQEDIYTKKIELNAASVGWCMQREVTTDHTITISGHMIMPVSDYEVVDIPGLCFEILTMPFSFISQAFNLTLFPGTPYQVNISSIFLAIIGVLIFILVLRMIISKGGGV